MMKLESRHTQRGFAIIEFAESYFTKCSLQEFRLGDSDIWFGPDHGQARIGPPWEDYELPENVQVSTRMHLTQEQVAEL